MQSCVFSGTAPHGWDIRFAYDAEGRRCKKTVTRKTTEDGKPAVTREETYFVWDDWNLIYERHENQFGMMLWDRAYHWGEDLAGGTTGANGVGGAGALLLIRDRRDFKRQVYVDHYPCYDTSGNVIALTDASGAITARYDHGPFGEPLLATGPESAANPIRWASKYYDSETGLYYFGKRYYDPRTAQWLTREPLGESASLNLYSYCHNDPVNKVDVLGLAEVPVWQASSELQALALQFGLVSDDAGDNDIIDTALLNARLTSVGRSPVQLINGMVCHPIMVCHGRSGGTVLEGVSRLFSVVNGRVHSSVDNADMTRKIIAGAWGNVRALGKDVGNLGHLLWNDFSYAMGETYGLDWGDHPAHYLAPFDADGSRIAGQRQIYPGISPDNLLVISGGFMSDSLVAAGGGKALSLAMRLPGRAAGWSVRLTPRPMVANGPLALPGPQIEARWGGLNTYRHGVGGKGGQMTAIEHISFRHAYDSGFSDVSRFTKGTSVRDIKFYVDNALRNGTVTPGKGNSFTIEHNTGRTIGTNPVGDAASSIRVHVRDGQIQTAFPF